MTSIKTEEKNKRKQLKAVRKQHDHLLTEIKALQQQQQQRNYTTPRRT